MALLDRGVRTIGVSDSTLLDHRFCIVTENSMTLSLSHVLETGHDTYRNVNESIYVTLTCQNLL